MFTFIHNPQIYANLYTPKIIYFSRLPSPIWAVNIIYLPFPTREMAKISPISHLLTAIALSHLPLGYDVIFNVSPASRLGDGPNMLHLPSPK